MTTTAIITIATQHTCTIEKDESGEYEVSCSCHTHYAGRLRSWTEAVDTASRHEALVASGAWQTEQARLAVIAAERAPINAAIRAASDAKDDLRSFGFAYLIARQKGGDVAAAMADVAAAREVLAAAERALAKFNV